MNKLDELCSIYRKCELDINSDDNEILENDSRTIDKINVEISLNKQANTNLICIFIEEDNKLIFKGLIKKSDDDLYNSYFDLKNDLYSLELEKFIDKYYEILKKNFK